MQHLVSTSHDLRSTQRAPLSPMRTNSPLGFRDRSMKPPASRKQQHTSTSPRTPTKFKENSTATTTATADTTANKTSIIITTPTREYESKITTITPYKLTRTDDDHYFDLEEEEDIVEQDNREVSKTKTTHLLSDVSFQLRTSAKRIHKQLDILVAGTSSNWEARQKALYQLAYRVRTCGGGNSSGGSSSDVQVEEDKSSYVLTFQGTSSSNSILRKLERAMANSLKDTRPRIVQASCDVICAVVDALSPKDKGIGSSEEADDDSTDADADADADVTAAVARLAVHVLPKLLTLCVSRQLSFKAPSRRGACLSSSFSPFFSLFFFSLFLLSSLLG